MHNGSWKLIQAYKHFAKYFKTLLFKFYPVSIVLLVVTQPPIHLVLFFFSDDGIDRIIPFKKMRRLGKIHLLENIGTTSD